MIGKLTFNFMSFCTFKYFFLKCSYIYRRHVFKPKKVQGQDGSQSCGILYSLAAVFYVDSSLHCSFVEYHQIQHVHFIVCIMLLDNVSKMFHMLRDSLCMAYRKYLVYIDQTTDFSISYCCIKYF